MRWVCFRDETQLRRDSTCTVTGLPPRVSLSGPSLPLPHRPTVPSGSCVESVFAAALAFPGCAGVG